MIGVEGHGHRARVIPAGGALGGAVREATLAVPAPFAWAELLEFLRARAIPGVEEVGPDGYRRTARLGRRAVVVEVRDDGSGTLGVSVHGVPPRADVGPVLDRLRHLFDLEIEPEVVAAALGQDPALAPLVREVPGLRVPGAWDGFEVGVRAVLGQQVTVKGASTLIGRVAAQFGTALPARLRRGTLRWVFPPPHRLLGSGVTSIGIPGARAACLVAFAHEVASARLRFDGAMVPDAFRDALLGIKGIGPWTAQYVAMRARHDPDAFPSGDLALLRVLAAPGETMRPRELETRAERWRPWRAYAAMHLWRAYARNAARAAGG